MKINERRWSEIQRASLRKRRIQHASLDLALAFLMIMGVAALYVLVIIPWIIHQLGPIR